MSYVPKAKEDGLRRYGRYDRKEDVKRCCVSVSNGTWDSKQCAHRRVVGEYCRQHDPESVAARRKKRPPTRFQIEMEMARQRAEFEKRVAEALVGMAQGSWRDEWHDVIAEARRRGFGGLRQDVKILGGGS